jgi:hypothetical protein
LGNFSRLESCYDEFTADYFCFCDQDDVWAADKLANLLKALVKIENDNNLKKLPKLVHNDLKVVGQGLNTINRSFVKMMGLFLQMSVCLADYYHKIK